ncbi:Baseplate protein J-like [uncultured Caudovirales phage]|uniref:Baseplate protein J-like n=1 Tax=uncultured Caudovirales phage TaxID=2100421 RepID=A0A6J5L7I6_9CAUD|nr:Baseplate protein J-like [uncultured Caudovirales phage]
MASQVTKNYIPQIDYVSRDYTAILADLTAIAQQFNPTWTASDPTDIGVTLLETFAYLGDILSFYTDRMASEGFIGTASQRASVLQIASMLGYSPTPSSAAVTTVTITNNDSVNPVTIPAGTQLSSTTTVNGQAVQVIFETDNSLTLAASASGSVSATQGATTAETLGISNGNPSQAFKLSQTGVTINSTGSNIEVAVGNVAYTYSSSLLDNTPYDAVFTTTMDADGYTYVVFGDGVGGKIPPTTYTIQVLYRVGVGADGNIPAGSIESTPITGSYNVTVVQPSGAYGGAAAESTDSIRYNVPRALRTLRRAVSLKDYAYLALQVSGVSKASADSSVWSSVNLYISPFGASAVNSYGPFNGSGTSVITSISETAIDATPGAGYMTYYAPAGTFSSLVPLPYNTTYVTVSGAAPATYNINVPTLVTHVASDGSSITVDTTIVTFPTYYPLQSADITVFASGASTAAFDNLKSSVLSYFTDKVAPNVTLNVLPPTYVPVNLELTLHVLPSHNQSDVASQAQSALSDMVSYNNSFFADRIPPHFILNALNDIAGVDYATVEHLRRNSNEQIFAIDNWSRAANAATLNIANGHNITAGQVVRLNGVGVIDGTYTVTSVDTTSVTIQVPADTPSPTGISGITNPGFAVVSLNTTAGIQVGMGVSGGTIPSGSVVTSISGSQIGISQMITVSDGGARDALTFTLTPPATNTIKVIAVDSSTSNGVTTYGISCTSKEIPTKGTFTITATGGLV